MSVEFIPNVEATILSIIQSRYSSFPVYQQFLGGNIDVLISISNSCKNNFRHVIYSLDVLHKFYALVKSQIFDPKDEIYEKLNDEMKTISLLVLSFAIEYKSSSLKYTDLDAFSDSFLFFHKMMSPSGTVGSDDEEKPRLVLFLEKYSIDDKKYNFYKSIFNYVTGVEDLSLESFKSEFKNKHNLVRGKVLPQYEVFYSLAYPNSYNLSDEEYGNQSFESGS